jgi:hypothetical protein
MDHVGVGVSANLDDLKKWPRGWLFVADMTIDIFFVDYVHHTVMNIYHTLLPHFQHLFQILSQDYSHWVMQVYACTHAWCLVANFAIALSYSLPHVTNITVSTWPPLHKCITILLQHDNFCCCPVTYSTKTTMQKRMPVPSPSYG